MPALAAISSIVTSGPRANSNESAASSKAVFFASSFGLQRGHFVLVMKCSSFAYQCKGSVERRDARMRPTTTVMSSREIHNSPVRLADTNLQQELPRGIVRKRKT